MKGGCVAVLVIAGLFVILLVYRSMRPAEVILDVPGTVAGAEIPGRSPSDTHSGQFYVSNGLHSDFSFLQVMSLRPQGRPEIVRGTFSEPVSGRSRAMEMLGTEDAYTVTSRTLGGFDHTGGPFSEFLLFRTAPHAQDIRGFFAATPAGVAAIESDMGRVPFVRGR